MKKMNSEGFAISGILYSMLILFAILIVGILGSMGNAKHLFEQTKGKIMYKLNGGIERISLNYNKVTLAKGIKASDYDLLDGVVTYNSDGEVVDNTSLSITSEPKFDRNTNGTYIITYAATDVKGNTIATERRTVIVTNPSVTTYNYNGSYHTFTADQNAIYKIELWGAQGGSTSDLGGKGAYTKGLINLTNGTKLYIYVGQKGGTSGGYNGGGKGDTSAKAGGGGATDVRLNSGAWNNFSSLKSRIMVAAGGGGGEKVEGGAGGGVVGMTSPTTYKYGISNAGGGEQIRGGYKADTAFSTTSDFMVYTHGTDGSFGKGGNGGSGEETALDYGGAGGGGYYGGGGSSYANGGGCGSSYISGHNGCNSISSASSTNDIVHTGLAIHYSNYYFTPLFS